MTRVNPSRSHPIGIPTSDPVGFHSNTFDARFDFEADDCQPQGK